MTPEQIEAIRERVERATPGPWRAVQEAGDNGRAWHCATGKWVWHAPSRSTFWTQADAELMAHAREDIPALLDEIAFLTERLDRANADYEACVQSHQRMNANYERALEVLEQIAKGTFSGASAFALAKHFMDSG